MQRDSDEIKTNIKPGEQRGGGQGAEKKPRSKMSTAVRLAVFWVVVFLVGAAIIATLFPGSSLKEVPISDVIGRANSGEISKLEISGDDVNVTVKGEETPTERSVKEGGSSIYDQGLETDAPVEQRP